MIDYKLKKIQETVTEIAVKFPKHIFEKQVNQSCMFLHVEQKHIKVTSAAFKFLFAINSMVCKDFFDENK